MTPRRSTIDEGDLDAGGRSEAAVDHGSDHHAELRIDAPVDERLAVRELVFRHDGDRDVDSWLTDRKERGLDERDDTGRRHLQEIGVGPGSDPSSSVTSPASSVVPGVASGCVHVGSPRLHAVTVAPASGVVPP